MKATKTAALVLLPLWTCAQAPDNANRRMYDDVRNNRNEYVLPIDKASVIGSYPLGVSEQKTVHIMFPSEIKEVDVGNRFVLVQVTEAFNNVLRVKANAREDFDETNVTVICRDGSLYSFIANYQDDPEVVNLAIGHNATADNAIAQALGINFVRHKVTDDNNESATELTDLAEQALGMKPFIHNVGVYTMKVSALLEGVYTAGDNLYYVVKINNRSDIDYTMAFTKAFVSDVSEMKRVAVQEEELPIKHRLPTDTVIPGGTDKSFVFVVPVRAISAKKQVDLEIYEDKGARHLRFTIDRRLIQKARKL